MVRKVVLLSLAKSLFFVFVFFGLARVFVPPRRHEARQKARKTKIDVV